MRVFLDTNVLVSAVTTRGLCADIVRAVLADHELVTCMKVLQEITRILHTKISVPDSLISEYLELIRQDATLAEAKEAPAVQIKDVDDIEIIGAAISAKADVMVTGDRELQNIKPMRILRIVSPRAFWEELKAQRGDASDGRQASSSPKRGVHVRAYR
jgi:putative PIN family toxin of toxin-antitoxin system